MAATPATVLAPTRSAISPAMTVSCSANSAFEFLDVAERLSRVFAALAGWKAARRELLLPLVRVWCSDDNAVLRRKLRSGIADRTAPLFAEVVARGAREGVFSVTHPDETARVVVALVQDLNDRLGEFLLAEPVAFALVERTVAAYTAAVARTLGVAEGKVVLVPPEALRPWFTSNGES